MASQQDKPAPRPKLSIVTSLYKTERYMDEFYTRSARTAEKITDDFEIIMVNDGSPDNALGKAVALHEKDGRVKVIDLARNFGQHPAMRAGIDYAKGDLVYVLDGDLEESPEWLSLFHEEMARWQDVDVVYGVQQERKGSFVRATCGKIYYRMLSYLSQAEIRPDHCNARLMTRRYVDSLKMLNDRTFSLESHFAFAGYKQVPVKVTKTYKGESGYNFRKRMDLALNNILGNSAFPLEIMSIGGLCLTILSMLFVVYLVVQRLWVGVVVAGNAIIVVSIWFIGGITIFCLGIVGLYISRIFLETKRHPTYIVKRTWE